LSYDPELIIRPVVFLGHFYAKRSAAHYTRRAAAVSPLSNIAKHTHCGNPSSLSLTILIALNIYHQYLHAEYKPRRPVLKYMHGLCVYTKFSHPAVMFWYSNQSINRHTARPEGLSALETLSYVLFSISFFIYCIVTEHC